MIAVADYGVGNLQSVIRMLKKAGADARLASQAADIEAADKIVLPGVGHFGHCAQRLRAAPFFDALQRCARDAMKPILGICVGGQLLGHSSEEAPGTPGLGWLDMRCVRFPDAPGYRVPRMEWGRIEPRAQAPLFRNLDRHSRFYFVHSYFMECASAETVMATTNHGFDYACAVRRDNIYGVQFHPEKSLRHGLGVLKAFADM
jgi:imidazole glycerol-phosphate synthase subunit HisH